MVIQCYFHCIPLIMSDYEHFHVFRFYFVSFFCDLSVHECKSHQKKWPQDLDLGARLGPGLRVELQTWRLLTCLLPWHSPYPRILGRQDTIPPKDNWVLDSAAQLVPWPGSVFKAVDIITFLVSIKIVFWRCLRVSPVFGVEIMKLTINMSLRCLWVWVSGFSSHVSFWERSFNSSFAKV